MQATQIEELESRLLTAPPPSYDVNWFKFDEISYRSICNLTQHDVPGLIAIAEWWVDEEWLAINDEDEPNLPILAWRALAEMKATEAVEPLLALANNAADDETGEWFGEDMPYVLACLGESIIPALTQFASDRSKNFQARICAISALNKIAKSECGSSSTASKFRIQEFLTGLMQQAADNPRSSADHDDPASLDFVRINSAVLTGLLDLKVAEAAPHIEKIFSENQIDVGCAGDWNVVRSQLGVRSLGLSMPESPINSQADFRRRTGFGIFSNRALVNFGTGQPDEEATNEYYETAMEAFGNSREGQQVTEKSGQIGWALSFLKYSFEHLGKTIDSMSVRDAKEVVFEIFPRKISTDPESAESIIFELQKFWQFIDRVYDVKHASELVQLFDDEAAKKLNSQLSDPRNFGMAKSIMMQGTEAGFDMTNQSEMNQFMDALNAGEVQIRGGSPSPKPKTKNVKLRLSAKQKKELSKQRKKLLAKKKKGNRKNK